MIFDRTFAAYLEPPPVLSLSQWAEEHAFLSVESAAVAGKWRAYPYQVGIMDALTDPANETVTWMKSTRVGYTKTINHSIAYHIHYDACPQMAVQPTVEDAEGYSKEEIAPMIRDTPAIAGLVADSKSRDSNNTILRKIYPGGFLVLVGANSARGFRRLTVRIVYFDEVDAYPPSAGVEGDQIKLGTRRTETFWNRLIVIGGTPTLKHFSRVERHFLMSDQRRYQVPCPICDEFQVLKWKRFVIPEKDPTRAHFKCKHCGKPIDEADKREIIGRGAWIAEAPFSGHAGFHIWAAYSFSPKTTWKAIAKEFLEAKDNPDLLRVWVNTVLGETWEDRGEAIDAKSVKKNVEDYPDQLDPGALLITVGADIQKDRIEAEFVAWGRGFESWSLDYVVIPGDPHFPETWKLFEEQLQRRFTRADGLPLRVHTTFVDSGFATGEVYRFTYPRQSRRVYATKGQATGGNQLVALSRKKYKRGLKLFTIATIAAKDKVFAYLQVKKPGPGYCHFPDRYDDDYFDGLTSEQRFTKLVKGVPTYFYKKTRTRNEPLDCRVLALAAVEQVAPNWDVLDRNLKRKADALADARVAEADADIAPKDAPEPEAPTAKTKTADPPKANRPKRRRSPNRRKGGFVHNW
jgi:phage terminase large subunit GpA-like protein